MNEAFRLMDQQPTGDIRKLSDGVLPAEPFPGDETGNFFARILVRAAVSQGRWIGVSVKHLAATGNDPGAVSQPMAHPVVWLSFNQNHPLAVKVRDARVRELV